MVAGDQKTAVLLLGKIKYAHQEWAHIEKISNVRRTTATNRDEFIQECKDGLFDGVLTIYRTFASVTITGKIDAELISVLPKSVKFICHKGAGYDQIDVAACTARSIQVSNTPDAVVEATADAAIWLLIGALRNFNTAAMSLRAGDWRGKTAPALGRDPRGKVLGILGMGGIGRDLAAKARVFGMEIIYHNRNKLDSKLEAGADYVDFESLLSRSDVLSLNLPLNPSTRHIISKPEFAMMKKGVIIINTARGAVMDEAALVDALASGQVANAGLDVYEAEPEIHPGLLASDKVLMLPHMGTYTLETETRMEQDAIHNVYSAAIVRKLRSIVPEQK